MQDLYIFVIDTDYYAGNFERNLCAYATGYVGECGVGRQMAQQFYEDMGLVDEGHEWNGEELSPEDMRNPFDYISPEQDEDGCRRPVKVWKSPNSDKHNSVAIFMTKAPPPGDVKVFKERAEAYMDQRVDVKPKPKILGFRLISRKTTYEELPLE